jgi:hypothetical protein
VSVETFRSADPEELRSWRARNSRIVRGKPVERRTGEEPAEPLEQGRPASPGTVYENLKDHLFSHFKRSREDFQIMARSLRHSHPQLVAHLSDEQIMAKLEEHWDERIRASIGETFPRLGRAEDLTIKTDGY